MIREYYDKLNNILDQIVMKPNNRFVIDEEIEEPNNLEELYNWFEKKQAEYPEFLWFMNRKQFQAIQNEDIDTFLSMLLKIYEKEGMIEWKE